MTSISAKKFEPLLLLSVLAMVITSGCVGGDWFGTGQGTGGGPGLVIEKLDTSLDLITSNEPVNLRLEVRNRGDYDGEIGTGAPAIVQLMQIDPTSWDIQPSAAIDLGTLLAPDPESQTEGGLATADWMLRAPYLDPGVRKTYDIAARVFYRYETTATKSIQFVTNQEMRTMAQSGQTFTSDPLVQTAGPLTLTVNTGQIIKADELSNARFQLQMKITNSGGGHIRGDNYPVAIDVEYPVWVMPMDGFCPGQTYWITPDYSDVPLVLPEPMGNFVYVWDGRATDVTCEFEIVDPPAAKTKGDFKITLKYIYSTEQTTQVTVKGEE